MPDTEDRAPTGVHDGRVGEAIAYAVEAHDSHRRKGTDIPYASHLLAVTALVLEHGGTPAQACAAVLHDVVEDCGGLERLADVRATFGDEIADMVAELSDSTAENPASKPPWRDRKGAYLERLREHAGSPAMLVSLADKTHNAEAIVADLTDPQGTPGLSVFDRFSASPMAVAWFHLELTHAFRSDPTLPRRLTDRLLAAALTIHDHALRVSVEIGARKQVAAGYALWAGTWGVMPVEALERMEAATARFRNARTVGDVRRHPSLPHDRFDDLLTWLGLAQTNHESLAGDDPEGDAEELQSTDAERLPDDLPLWPGWDLPIAAEHEYPALPDVPWEDDGSSIGYHGWAPQELLEVTDDGELDSPMQEFSRTDLTVSDEELIEILTNVGWELVDEGGRYADVAFGIGHPWTGGWTPLPDQPPLPDGLRVPKPRKRSAPPRPGRVP